MKEEKEEFGLPTLEFSAISPLPVIPSIEDILKNLRGFGEENEAQFLSTLREIEEFLLQFNPLDILSKFSYYNLSQPIKSAYDLAKEGPVLQHHVEIMQSLMLMHSESDFEHNILLPSDFEKLQELIIALSISFNIKRLKSTSLNNHEFDRTSFIIIEHMRHHTLALRNWGYPEQIFRIVSEITDSLDGDIYRRYNVRPKCICKMFSNIVILIEDKISRHLKDLQFVYAGESIEEMIERYYSIFTGLKEKNGFLKYIKEQKLDKEQLKIVILNHSDLRLMDNYRLTLQDFTAAYEDYVEKEVLLKLLVHLTMKFGELKEYNKEFIFMDNPIWTKPLIKLDDKDYYLPIPALLISFCMEIIESIIFKYPYLKTKYEDARADYLEKKILSLFESNFPGSNIACGIRWKDSDSQKDYENDLIVLVENTLLIVEAKSGRITGSALRGAEMRLRETIEKLQIESSRQSMRFEKYWREEKSLEITDKNGDHIKLRYSDNIRIVRVNITLGLLGTLCLPYKVLSEMKLINQDEKLAITISLTDLELIFDLLDSKSEKLHYFIRRSQFELHANYFGDEVDLLRFYLESGFNIGSSEFDGTELSLFGLSSQFHPYYLGIQHGLDVVKPRKKNSKFINDIIIKLEGRNVPRWSEIGYILLNISYDDQLEFENGIRQVKNNVKYAKRGDKPQNSIVLSNGPKQRKDLIIGIAYRNTSAELRNNLIFNIGEDVMNEYSQDKALVIGVNVDRNDYPYSFIGLINKKI